MMMLLLLLLLVGVFQSTATIDRQAVVERHTPTLTCSSWKSKECNPLDFQTLGNGALAFSVDVTGLQTFNATLQSGGLCNPLNTMAEWGWHTTPVEKSLQFANATPHDFEWQHVPTYNHTGALYPTGCKSRTPYKPCMYGNTEQKETTAWLRANPHRLNLGRLSFVTDGAGGDGGVAMEDIENISQTLNLWAGFVSSSFILAGHPVQVTTAVHPTLDLVSVKVVSAALAELGLHVQLSFPYGSEEMNSNGADWTRPHAHTSTLKQLPPASMPAPTDLGTGTTAASFKPTAVAAEVTRVLDNDKYATTITIETVAEADAGGGAAPTLPRITPSIKGPHTFDLYGPGGSNTMAFSVSFKQQVEVAHPASNASTASPRKKLPTVVETLASSKSAWKAYWMSGAAVDFSKSTDPRAHQLENKIVMSQYVENSQDSGTQPTAETALVSNSWWGKFHGEMRMWHQSHFTAWGRPAIFAKSTEYYLTLLDEAKGYAAKQKYAGARWFKMRAHASNSGLFTGPSVVGPLLLQQQSHPIVYAELLYRAEPSNRTLAKYGSMVHETAEFMASFALQAKGFNTRGCLDLGPPMAPGMGVEASDPGNEMNWTNTANGCYENVYWRFGLSIAQEWRARQGLPVEPRWAEVSATLCKPQVRNWKGKPAYFFDDGSTELIGPSTSLGQVYSCGHIPCTSHGINTTVMQSTLKMSIAEFNFSNAYPGDNAVYSMAAARLGEYGLAIDLLSDKTNTVTNVYNKNNGFWQGFFPALVGTNGQFLYAVAMLVGGWGNRTSTSGNAGTAPGFPVQGWSIEAEGFPGLF